MLGFELEVAAKTFDRFGWERDRGSKAQDRLMSDWMDCLQDYPLSEVKAAIAACGDEDPKRSPNHFQVRTQIHKARAKMVRRNPEPGSQRERASADFVEAEMKRVGFAPRRFGGV